MKKTDYRVLHWHNSGKDTFSVHQVYYDDRENPIKISDEPISMSTSSLTELKDRNFHIAGAFLQDILPGHLFTSSLTNKPTTANIMNTLFPNRVDKGNDVESQSNSS